MDAARDAPHLADLTARLVARWPDHAGYVAKSLEGRGAAVMAVSDQLARIILILGAGMAGGMEGLLDDYRFLCESICCPRSCISGATEPIG